MTTFYLVRHAQSLPDAAQAEPDWPLSPVGEAQARGLAEILAPFGVTRLYCSPYRRCLDTLAPFAAASGLELAVDPGLRERRIAGTWLCDFRDVWRRSWTDFAYALDGGESSWTCRRRIATAAEAIAARHPDETVVLGSHGNAIGLLMNYVEPSFGLAEASALRTPEILRIVHRGGRFAWDRAFAPGASFDSLATDFRKTPGVIA